MALVTLMRIVDRARAAAGNRADRGARSAARNGADGRATSRTYTYSLDGPTNVVPAVIAVINHISNYCVMS